MKILSSCPSLSKLKKLIKPDPTTLTPERTYSNLYLAVEYYVTNMATPSDDS